MEYVYGVRDMWYGHGHGVITSDALSSENFDVFRDRKRSLRVFNQRRVKLPVIVIAITIA